MAKVKKVVTKKDAAVYDKTLQAWKDGKTLKHKFLIPATLRRGDVNYAELKITPRYSKSKGTMSWAIELGGTGKELFVTASSKTLGWASIFKPQDIKTFGAVVSENVL